MKRTSGLIVVLLLGGLLVGGVLLLLGQEPQVLSTPTPTSSDMPLATVDGQVIGLNFWAQEYLVDQVMSRLAGQPSPAPRETLERLINEVVLLQAYPPDGRISEEQVTQRVDELAVAWKITDVTLTAYLEAAGLSREVLTTTVQRLVLVEMAQSELLASGEDPLTWVVNARDTHQIWIDEVLFSGIVPPIALTPTPVSYYIPGASLKRWGQSEGGLVRYGSAWAALELYWDWG